jgi:hypothetical protein
MIETLGRHQNVWPDVAYWHEPADPECPLHGRFRGVSSIGQCNTTEIFLRVARPLEISHSQDRFCIVCI